MPTQEGIFSRFDDDDVIPGQVNVVSSGMWSGGSGTLTSFYTSSTQSGSTGEHYYDVYNGVVGTNATASVQMSVTYGHKTGLGSLSGDNNYKASKAIYAQLKNLLLPQNEASFSYAPNNASSSNSIYAISVNRSRLKEKMDPGNWELHLSGSDESTIKLIDDSGATADPNVKSTVREFSIISGSIASGTAVEPTSGRKHFGKFYPETGIMIIDADELGGATVVAGYSVASNANANNSALFFNAIKGGAYFAARREEQIKSTHYFCRVKHGNYNHSQNPTYYSGSNADLTIPSFKTDPKSYITTVGLYNDSNELLAVAKLSRPVLKSTSREALIKVRLDF
jgi:hypothetical protein